MLWREPIIDRDHDTSRALAQIAAHRIVGFDIAERKAATVQIDQNRQRALPFGRIDPDRQARAVRVDLSIFDLFHLGAIAGGCEERPDHLARLRDRQRFERWRAGGGSLFEKCINLWIERHRWISLELSAKHHRTLLVQSGTIVTAKCTASPT